ncbi:hypothetical protein BO83DRAFT_371582 [Aspergillus eucalypticola CBS 122712]|uniref:Phytanoyl-CoA dioxygenase n=1 Tax=Aspergillus eucalypticola (strain CBS 122712 / IBT 29274) TaxID=1448314 RepID=A0A317UN59_ASPEC|nr:uncharacterized protein BO83DRAFT_371582 [Aspergillus eucalypticola CBS 122712]PWY63141.1 hypothetical protein BO83DRAFT_371582 [Aspergillus eucalypticola CBS 122712]
MPTSIGTTVSTQTKIRPTVRLAAVDGDAEKHPDWLVELHTKGWTVVRGALPRETALAYANKAYEWLESWDLGFDRKDPSTRKAANLPWHTRGGLYSRYGVGHEQFVWDLKSEPGLVEKWEQIWGTRELLVSFDGLNLSLPEKERPKSDPIFAPWAHVDQSPFNNKFDTVQGILNLLPNGPEDGGLMVFEGSSSCYTELWQHFDHKKGEKGWSTWAYQSVDEEMCQWLEARGCKWTKVCAEPGDLLLWDSRTIHYGAAPSSVNDRFAAYVCYKPAAAISEEAKKVRLQAFEAKQNTTHDPADFRVREYLPPADHPTYEAAIKRPLQSPVLSKRARELIGLDLY